jgi:hypothetical protein
MMLWYTARGAGLAALVALSAATALGALVSMPSRNAARRVVVQYAHRAAAVLGLALLAVHLTAILADGQAHVGVIGALVPFQSSYRPGSVALSSLAAYLFLGVSTLGLARGRLAQSPEAVRVWRWLHALAYAGWGAAMLHGFRSGTDVGEGWVDALFVVCLVAVLAAIAGRLVSLARSGYVRRAMLPIEASR